MLIGPFTPGFVGNREQIAVLADVGVIFLMFALGVAFSLKDLARVRNIAVFGTLVQVLLTMAGGMVGRRRARLEHDAGHCSSARRSQRAAPW